MKNFFPKNFDFSVSNCNIFPFLEHCILYGSVFTLPKCGFFFKSIIGKYPKIRFRTACFIGKLVQNVLLICVRYRFCILLEQRIRCVLIAFRF